MQLDRPRRSLLAPLAGTPTRIAATAALLMLMASTDARSDPGYAAWRIAHERMLAKWRHSEPRCGWTVGGYTCGTRPLRRYLGRTDHLEPGRTDEIVK